MPFARSAVVRAVLLGSLAMFVAPQPAPSAPAPTTTQEQVSGPYKMRKLHLVRPDLIHYPLAIETYC